MNPFDRVDSGVGAVADRDRRWSVLPIAEDSPDPGGEDDQYAGGEEAIRGCEAGGVDYNAIRGE